MQLQWKTNTNQKEMKNNAPTDYILHCMDIAIVNTEIQIRPWKKYCDPIKFNSIKFSKEIMNKTIRKKVGTRHSMMPLTFNEYKNKFSFQGS